MRFTVTVSKDFGGSMAAGFDSLEGALAGVTLVAFTLWGTQGMLEAQQTFRRRKYAPEEYKAHGRGDYWITLRAHLSVQEEKDGHDRQAGGVGGGAS